MEIKLKKNKEYHVYVSEKLTGTRVHLIAEFVDQKDFLLQFYDKKTGEPFIVSFANLEYCFPFSRGGLNE